MYVAPNGSDSNPGTLAQPWKTIAHADAQIAEGTIVHVAPGTYQGPIVTNKSGSVSKRIRWLSDSKWGAKIVASGSEWVCPKNGGARIIANHVHDMTGMGCNSNGGAGIVVDYWCGGEGGDTVGNLVERIGPPGKCNTVHGIYHQTKGGSVVNNIAHDTSGWGITTWHAATAVTIANNLSFHNRAGGIAIYLP